MQFNKNYIINDIFFKIVGLKNKTIKFRYKLIWDKLNNSHESKRTPNLKT